MKKWRDCNMDIERRQCGIKIVEIEKDINYIIEDIKEIKESIKELRDDFKKVISVISELKGKASMFGAIGGVIAGFLTAILAYFLKGK